MREKPTTFTMPARSQPLLKDHDDRIKYLEARVKTLEQANTALIAKIKNRS